jgi:acyl phosphate:glycerol-3-phosphate acyltransferase
VVLLFSYLLGAVPVGLMVGLARGVDIRKFGSGNIGATNVLRTLGLPAATVVFIGDTAKGAVPMFVAKHFFSQQHYAPYLVIAAGFLAIVGHTASPFLRFKGGKGVETSLGMIIGMNPVIAAISFVSWVSLVAITRYVSIASILASLSVPVMMHFWKQQAVPREYTVCALVAALLILARHRTNIGRLMRGEEPKIGQKVRIEGGKRDG